jgi:hypothetical protein
MRKLLLLGAAALLAAPAVASIDDDFLQLTGTIDYQCDVTMLGQASATVNMRSVGSAQKLADVRYLCNDVDGFKSRVRSTNGSKLVSGAYSRDYTASLQGGHPDAAPINFTDRTLTNGGAFDEAVGFRAGAATDAGSVHGFFITLQAGDPLPGGTPLSDQIIFELDGR